VHRHLCCEAGGHATTGSGTARKLGHILYVRDCWVLSPVCTHGARKPGHKRHCSTSWDGYGFQAIWDAIASPWAIALFTLLPYRVFDGLLLVWRHGTEYVSCSFKTVQRPPPVTTTRSDRDMQGYQLSSGVKARAACILCLAVCQVVLTPAARIHQGQSQILETLWLVMHHASLHSLLCPQHSCNPTGTQPSSAWCRTGAWMEQGALCRRSLEGHRLTTLYV